MVFSGPKEGNSSSPNAKDQHSSGTCEPVPLYRNGSFISLPLAEGLFSYTRCLSAYQSTRWYHKHLSHISKSILILALLTSSSSQAPLPTHTPILLVTLLFSLFALLCSCFPPCVHYPPSTAILPLSQTALESSLLAVFSSLSLL